MYDCKAPLSRFYYPDTRRIINAFIIIIKRYREANKESKRVVAIAKYSRLHDALKGKEIRKKDLQASQCQENNDNGHWKGKIIIIIIIIGQP